MGLTDRIKERRQPTEVVVPLVERRVNERRVPTWVKRMQDGELKDKDMTGRVAA